MSIPVRSRSCVLGSLFLLGSAMLLSACAVSNEGATDLRKPWPLAAAHQTSKDKALDPSCKTSASKSLPDVGSGLSPLRLKSYRTSSDALVSEGSRLSVHLRWAYIKEFFEIFGNPFRGRGPNGEIAIVANVFETGGPDSLDFSKQNMESGRVVYYNDDVEKGQFFNFHNLPVYGPKTYGGAPVVLQFGIFELDSTPEQLKAVLQTVAGAGGAAYPPAGPVLKVLNDIGGSLLKGQQDDRAFKYVWSLSPLGGYDKMQHPLLEAGYYVLIREENRQSSTPWNALAFCENEGKLYWTGKKDKNGEILPYTDNTYLVVEINKDLSAKDIDLKQQTFGQLQAALKKQDTENAARLSEGLKSVGQLLAARVQIRNFDDARSVLAHFRTDPESPTNAARTRQLLEMIKDSVTVKEDGSVAFKPIDISIPDETPPLSEKQIRHLHLRILEMIGSGGKDVSGLTLEELVKASSLADLLKLAKAAAESPPPAETNKKPEVTKETLPPPAN